MGRMVIERNVRPGNWQVVLCPGSAQEILQENNVRATLKVPVSFLIVRPVDVISRSAVWPTYQHQIQSILASLSYLALMLANCLFSFAQYDTHSLFIQSQQ